jgi:hypothetical protein
MAALAPAMSPQMLKRLCDIANDEAMIDGATRVKAAMAILDRGLGKVREAEEEKGPVAIIELSPEQVELQERLIRALPEIMKNGTP